MINEPGENIPHSLIHTRISAPQASRATDGPSALQIGDIAMNSKSSVDQDKSSSAKPDKSPEPSPPRSRARTILVVLGLFVLVGGTVWFVLSRIQNSIQAAAVAKSGDAKKPKVILPTNNQKPKKVANPKDENRHPLEPVLDFARDGLKNIRENVTDYTATIIQRERINGKLREESFMFAKIRNRKLDKDGNIKVPLSVYLKYLKPKAVAGREVIWIENENDGNLIAHEPGIKNIVRFKLDPKGPIAMWGQRYSINNIGMENLVVKLIERGQQELKYEQCDVVFEKGAKLDNQECTLIQVMHPEKRPEFTFFKAQILIDDARQIPLRYVAYLWPETPGGEPLIDEEYTYKNVKLNVGLKDSDFDPDNPDYNFP